MPLSNSDNGFFLTMALKVVGFFLSFVGGIVAATWTIASKIKGFESRIKDIEVSQSTCQLKTIGAMQNDLTKIDNKLDKVHERIDALLLQGSVHVADGNVTGRRDIPRCDR